MGCNTVYEFEGRKYHLQAEDLADGLKSFEVRVYDGGTVLWLKRFSYAELDALGLKGHDYELAVRGKMEKTLLTVEAAIAKGKIP